MCQTFLPPHFRDGKRFFTNCGTIASFRVSRQDAELLVREFATTLPAQELQTLSNHELYLRAIEGGAPSRPQLLRTFPPTPATGNENPKEKIIRVSLEQFGKPISEVEEKLKRYLAVSVPAKEREL